MKNTSEVRTAFPQKHSGPVFSCCLRTVGFSGHYRTTLFMMIDFWAFLVVMAKRHFDVHRCITTLEQCLFSALSLFKKKKKFHLFISLFILFTFCFYFLIVLCVFIVHVFICSFGRSRGWSWSFRTQLSLCTSC